MPAISKLLVELGVDVKNLGKDLRAFQSKVTSAFDKVEKRTNKLAKAFKAAGIALAGFLGVRAIAGYAKNTIDLADQIGKLNQRLGISTEALSELRFAAEKSGIQFNELTTGFQRAIRRLDEFRETGKGVAAQALKELGGGLAESVRRGESFESLLPRLADRFRALGSEAQRVRVSFALFDTEGVKLGTQLLALGSEAIAGLREEAANLGLTLDKQTTAAAERFNDRLTEMQGLAQGAANAVLKAAADLEAKKPFDNIPAPGFGFTGPPSPRRAPIPQESVGPQPIGPSAFDQIFGGIQKGLEQGRAFDELVGNLSAGFGEMGRMVEAFGSATDRAFTGMVTNVAEGVAALEPAKSQVQEFVDTWKVGAQDVMFAIGSTVDSFAAGVGSAIANVIVEGQNMAAAMIGVLKQIAKQVIATLIQLGIQFIAFNVLGKLLSVSSTKTKVAGHASVAGAASVAAAISELGLIGLFAAPAFAALGAAAAVAGATTGAAAGSAFTPPQFASGGVATQPTLGVFGEAGPEALIPLDQYRGFGNQVAIVNVDGQEIARAVFEHLPGVAHREGLAIG